MKRFWQLLWQYHYRPKQPQSIVKMGYMITYDNNKINHHFRESTNVGFAELLHQIHELAKCLEAHPYIHPLALIITALHDTQYNLSLIHI